MPTFEVVRCTADGQMHDDPETAKRLLNRLSKRRQTWSEKQAMWPASIKKLVRFQAHVRGAIERVAFHDTLMCEMQDILESQDPDLEEQYDLLDAFCNRVYASY